MGVIKITSFIYSTKFKFIYLKYVHSVPKFKVTISHYLCCLLGLYFASYHMLLFSTYHEDSRMFEYIVIIASQDYLDQV